MPEISQRPSPHPARSAARASLILLLAACQGSGPTATVGGATEATLCRVWGESLPTRSHADSPQTQAEIGDAYADFAAACPAHAHLIP